MNKPWCRMLSAAVLVGLAASCSGNREAGEKSGTLSVYAAGSLGIPFSELLAAFEEDHPGIETSLELSGSVVAVRKITDLGRTPDILAVADYTLLPKFMIPDHAGWGVAFATNAMVLVYGARSVGADVISAENWPTVLARPDVLWGLSDPEQDPAGYRARMVIQLTEVLSGTEGLARSLLESDRLMIRPKSADLMALLQLGELDYAWAYRSLALQNGLPFVELPPEVNLGSPELADTYARVSTTVPRTGGEPVVIPGEPIAYGVTVPHGSPNEEAAEAFVRFLLSPRGGEILRGTFLEPLETPMVSGSPPRWISP